jgi:hypothetical protein
MTSEDEIRLRDIHQGPWRQQARLARDVGSGLSPDQEKRLFRSHYQEGIYDEDEVAFRESFDQVLEELQLLELAVAAGYLPLDAVRSSAQYDFHTLVGSEAARAYLQTYDYVAVRNLAARLEIELGLAPVQPPEINPSAAVRYATFLAVHSDFTASEPIGRFTMLLDDYLFDTRTHALFFQMYLAGTAKPSESEQVTLEDLRLGLMLFVEMLGDLFLQFPDAEKPLYGCVYAYWLSHFFGVRRTVTGYQRYGVSFEDVPGRPLLFPDGMDADVRTAERLRMETRIATLRDTWDRTRALIESLERA